MKNHITTTLVLLAHYPKRAKNVEKIVEKFLEGDTAPNEIIVFVDDSKVELNLPSFIHIIYSSKSISVMARLFVSTFANSTHVMLLDTDLMPKKDTLRKLTEFASLYPKAVLGHEGVTLDKDSMTPYTSVKTHTVKKVEECDVLIRSYYVPIQVFANGLKMFWEDSLPDRYADDLIICLANRFLAKEKNYIVPVEFEELNDMGIGQCKNQEHYVIRNQVCRHLIEKYH